MKKRGKKKPTRLRWLNRSAFQMPIYIALATSQEILDAELKRMKFPGSFGVNSGAGATTNFLENNIGEKCAVVCLFEHNQERQQIYALLAHEAVHIFQEVMSVMGEDTPSKEFMAWTVQKISQSLFYEYDRQRGNS